MTARNQHRNAFWGLISTVVDIVCGLYTSRLILNAYGAPAHGLINTINNFLGLILAIELVFIRNGKTSFYQTLENEDYYKLSQNYHRYKRTAHRVGSLAAISTIVIALIFPLFYLDQFTYWDTALLVVALGLYVLITASTRIDTGLLIADYKSYLVNILSTFTTLLTALLCYLFIQWGYSLQAVKIMVALVLLIHPLFYCLYVRRHFKLRKPTENVAITPMPRVVVVERVTNIILGRTDVFILAIAATLTDVSIYAVYYMVGKYLAHLIYSVFNGREAIYGRAFANQDKPSVKKAYAETHFWLANLLGVGFGIAVVMLNPFVLLYTKFVYGVNYDQFFFGFLVLIAQMLSCIRDAQMKVIYASGNIRHGRMLFAAIMEAVINVVISIALVWWLGLVGVAIGTVAALGYRVISLLIYRRKHVVKGKLWRYLRNYVPTVLMISAALVMVFVWEPHPSNRVEWLLDCTKFGVIFVALDLLLNLIVNHAFTKRVLIKYINKFTKGIYQSIKKTVVFAWKSLGGIYQRGLFRAIRTYFRHKKAVAFAAQNTEMADLPYLTKLGKIYMGTTMDLTHPKTLNEKINWLKMNYQTDQITTMSDKAAAKDYVAKILGPQYIVPTYGVWDSFEQIDWDSLPQSFVLKCTHDSGSIYVVKDKTKLNLTAAKKHFEHYLNNAYWRKMREWGYKNIQPRIIAEKYLPSLGHRHSTEYKFTCFNGKVVFGTVCSGVPHGFNKRRVNDFYDPAFNHLSWRAWYHNDRRRPQKPAQWETMLAISEKFAQGLPYLRVDLYVVDDQIYFGEFTFYTGGGFIEFHPRKMDLILGEQLALPSEPIIADDIMHRLHAMQTYLANTTNDQCRHKAKIYIKNHFTDPDEKYLKGLGKIYLGYQMDLTQPRTFNEKICWLKMHYRPAFYQFIFDRLAIRDYVASTIGDDHLLPILDLQQRFENLDFAKIPEQSYVYSNYPTYPIKITNQNRTKPNQVIQRIQLNCQSVCILQKHRNKLSHNGIQYYLAELRPTSDTKHHLYCYYVDGKIQFVKIHVSDGTAQYYTPDFQPLNWATLERPQTTKKLEKLKLWDKIIAAGQKLAGTLPFVGIHFMIQDDQFYLINYSFEIDNGFAQFVPAELDLTIGDMIELPKLCDDGYLPDFMPNVTAKTQQTEPTEDIDIGEEDFDE